MHHGYACKGDEHLFSQRLKPLAQGRALGPKRAASVLSFSRSPTRTLPSKIMRSSSTLSAEVSECSWISSSGEGAIDSVIDLSIEGMIPAKHRLTAKLKTVDSRQKECNLAAVLRQESRLSSSTPCGLGGSDAAASHARRCAVHCRVASRRRARARIPRSQARRAELARVFRGSVTPRDRYARAGWPRSILRTAASDSGRARRARRHSACRNAQRYRFAHVRLRRHASCNAHSSRRSCRIREP